MKLFIYLLIAATLATATDSVPGYVPSGDTAVASTTVRLTSLWRNNFSGSSVANCVLKDRSTNCGGGACTLFGPITLSAANSTSGPSATSVPLNGLLATSGFTWSCGTGSAVVGSVSWY